MSNAANLTHIDVFDLRGMVSRRSWASPSRRDQLRQALRMPDWLQPHKDQWLTRGSLCKLFCAKKISFGSWFDKVEARLRRVVEEHPVHGHRTLYLVKHVWAASRAWNIDLYQMPVPPRPQIESDYLIVVKERDRLMREVELRKRQVALSREMARMLVSSIDPRPIPGVYFLFSEQHEIIYIGTSNNVICRMAGHKDKPFAYAKMIPVGDDEREIVERRMIAYFQPPLNSQLLRVA